MLSGKTDPTWDPTELVVDPAAAHRERATHDPGDRPASSTTCTSARSNASRWKRCDRAATRTGIGGVRAPTTT